MSEMEEHAAILEAECASSSSKAASAGALLRSAREAAGVDAVALAGALKISLAKLEALETDDFMALPNVAFARALASSIGRILQVDSIPILELMPKNELPDWRIAKSSINASFKDGSEQSRRGPFLLQVTRPVGVIVILLLVGALVLVLLPYRADSFENLLKPATGEASSSQLNSQTGLDEAAAVPTALPNPASSVVNPVISEPLTAQLALAPSEALTLDTANPAEEKMDGFLTFHAREGSWVQVKDAAGTVILQRTLVKGEKASVSAGAPLIVVVGKANSTDVFVRGVAFDLSHATRENVARFEVKQ